MMKGISRQGRSNSMDLMDHLRLEIMMSGREKGDPLVYFDTMLKLIDAKWTQGDYMMLTPEKDAEKGPPDKFEHYQNVCLLGSITAARETNSFNMDLMEFMVLYIYHQIHPMEVVSMRDMDKIMLKAITDWNDAPGRTKEEVLDVVRKARAMYLSELDNPPTLVDRMNAGVAALKNARQDTDRATRH